MAHAAFTPVLTAESVVWVYAWPSAVARAAYAALSALVKAVTAESIATSRAFTAAPMQAIFVVMEALVEVPVFIMCAPAPIEVWANAGATESAMMPKAILLAKMFLFI